MAISVKAPCTLFLISILWISPVFPGTVSFLYDGQGRTIRCAYVLEKSAHESIFKTISIQYQYDWAGNMIGCSVDADRMPGDIDGNRLVDLGDALRAVQICHGMPVGGPDTAAADVDGDWKIGTSESVYLLQKLAELR